MLLGLTLTVQAQNKQKFAGYLFAYFEGGGDQNLMEQLRFAVSEDAQNWYALNGNRPIIARDSISESGGIRDPHILRGDDGFYYIVATDMHTYDPKQGWGANPGIVLLMVSHTCCTSSSPLTMPSLSMPKKREPPKPLAKALTLFNQLLGFFSSNITLKSYAVHSDIRVFNSIIDDYFYKSCLSPFKGTTFYSKRDTYC